ncbi:MAG TPA: response regulator, partial [Sulfuricurvum sp.]|nr:response regulator [Sulfuricurvum sp.]
MKLQEEQLSKVFLIIAIIWTLFIAFMVAFLAYQKYQQTISLALLEAKTSTNKDLAYRKWVATHGGVYVPIAPDTPPNPFLTVKNRDLNTTSGIQMTLINPAYALRQMTEQYSALYGIRSHLTSDKYINPANA